MEALTPTRSDCGTKPPSFASRMTRGILPKNAMRLAISLFTFAAPSWVHAAPIPPTPQYYVYDEPKALTEHQNKALATLLIEHDQASGEQIMVAIFESLDSIDTPQGDSSQKDVMSQTNRVFTSWDVSRRLGGSGGLFAIFLREKEARIETGYGLGATLSELESRSVIRDFLLPQLNGGDAYRAVSLSVLEMLRAAESPLIESGRAREILRAGGLQEDLAPKSPVRFPWILSLALGTFPFLIFLYRFSAAEAHFTSSGWFRPHPGRQAWFLMREALSRTGRGGAARRPKASTGGADAHW